MRNEARIPLLKLLLSHFLYEIVKSVHIAFYSVRALRLQGVAFGTYYKGRQGHCSFNGNNKPNQSLFKLIMPNGFPPIFLIQKHTPLSVQFSRSVMSDSLWSYGLQHARPACPSPTARVFPDSCPLSQWCHPNISSSVVPFSSCLQSFPASVSFQMSQFFSSGGQSIGVSTSVLPVNTQDCSP